MQNEINSLISSHLEAVNVIPQYDHRVISENISIKIPDRSFTVIFRTNVCGKSTLFRTFFNLIKLQRVNVSVFGLLK